MVDIASAFPADSRKIWLPSPIEAFNAIFRRGASAVQQQQGAGAVSSFSSGNGTYTPRSRVPGDS